MNNSLKSLLLSAAVATALAAPGVSFANAEIEK
jgi:hypothetical protein